jgi:hypothetical protein
MLRYTIFFIFRGKGRPDVRANGNHMSEISLSGDWFPNFFRKTLTLSDRHTTTNGVAGEQWSWLPQQQKDQKLSNK